MSNLLELRTGALEYLRFIVEDLSTDRGPYGLRSFVTDGEFHKILTAILDDEGALCNLLQTAYLHVNGFRKVVLANCGKEGGELRIHEWLPSDGRTNDKHNHPWNFASLVLEGTLINETFAETPGATHERSVVGPVGGGRDGYHYIKDTFVGLQLSTASQLEAGSGYFMNHALVHNAFAPAGAVTVVAQGRFLKEVTFGYRPVGAQARPQGLLRLRMEELVALLRRCLGSV